MKKRRNPGWKTLLLAGLMAVASGVCPMPAMDMGQSPVEAATEKKLSITVKANYTAAYEVLKLTNERRAEAGAGPLVMDMDLMEGAMQRSAEAVVMMAATDGLTHTRPNGLECYTVCSKCYGENIACGQRSAEQVVSAWMNSTMGHRENMLNEEYASIGIGCVEVNDIMVMYWTQDFGYTTAKTGAQPKDATRTFTVDASDANYSAALAAASYKDIIKDGSAGSWKKDGKGWWYRNADGSYVASDWLQDGGKWYYFDSNGYMVTGWKKIGSKWYFFNSNGTMYKGWLSFDGKWYYLNGSGAMVTGWKKIGSSWYYFRSGGDMKTGWLKWGGDWYYLKSSGAMATGKVTVNKKVYQFGTDGICLNP